MTTDVFQQSLRVLRTEIQRGEDVYESPSLIHQVALALGGQPLLCGEPSHVEELFNLLSPNVESSLFFEWLRISMMYADDGGSGLRQLAAGWVGSSNRYKAYIASNLEGFFWN
jgi:hypothetical protein